MKELDKDLSKVDFMQAKKRLSIPLLSQVPKMSVADIEAAIEKQKEY